MPTTLLRKQEVLGRVKVQGWLSVPLAALPHLGPRRGQITGDYPGQTRFGSSPERKSALTARFLLA